ncbi:MAG TPA: ABC transporter substrate-binding protein [Nocardioidaceae bacterium]|nr:ABC transporter substrate-binding protein [Nocardioidaceae bacterium]
MARTRGPRLVKTGAVLATALSTLLLTAACGSGSGGNGGSGGFSVSKDSTIASEVPSSIASKGTLVVATDATYAPNEFKNIKTGAIEGMDVDLGTALGTVMGLKWKFMNASFDTIIPGLASGKYDIGMSSFTDTKERQKTVDFVTYFSAGTSFYTAASGGPKVTGLSSLCGLSVGVEKGTTQQDDSTAQSKKCTNAGKKAVNVVVFPDQNGANVALSAGRVQVVMADSPVAAYAVKQSNGKFKLVGQTYGTAPYGIAIPRPAGTPAGQAPMDKPVLDALNKLISDGVYQKILAKWGVQGGAITNPTINGATS